MTLSEVRKFLEDLEEGEPFIVFPDDYYPVEIAFGYTIFHDDWVEIETPTLIHDGMEFENIRLVKCPKLLGVLVGYK